MNEPLAFPPEGEIRVNWEEFELKIRELRELHSLRRTWSPLLFRGHEDAEWKLQTTLERRKWSNMRFFDYYAVINSIKPQIEAFTRQVWSIPDVTSVMHRLEDYDTFSLDFDNDNFPAQQYMVYLRHHGFPSPLLDWTRSPYIAAHFAFSSQRTPPKGQAAIYCFLDAPENVKGSSNREPIIRRLGVHLPCHPRHFLQQADYTGLPV